ncbi:MAG: 50S ribosomal protein L34 [Sedimentisphaerales bacterium]|nr:50S ribosomal protein L34 [Sedimentisphaerales bacterium]
MENHRKSYIKRARTHGFLVRQRTAKGRKIHSRKRRVGRCVNVRKTFS